uniref:Uncharacterized protein n=1 Tax=Mesocestoides corti TaxID=53468 RepID=A0A5K3G212_MESCO
MPELDVPRSLLTPTAHISIAAFCSPLHAIHHLPAFSSLSLHSPLRHVCLTHVTPHPRHFSTCLSTCHFTSRLLQ